MLPVWPFRRSIRHQTFGRLRRIRNGQYWRARVALPHGGDERTVDVHLNAHAPTGPTPAQESFFQRLSAQYPDVYARALAAVHEEYQRVRRLQPSLKWPTAPCVTTEVAELERLTPLHHIWLDDHVDEQFVLSFGHAADKEHSFHVRFRQGRLESVASER